MLYYLGNARSEKQRQEMIALETAGICIFCPESYCYGSAEPKALVEFQGGVSRQKKVIEANGTWAILRNEYPYQGASEHVMLVPSRHVTAMHELPDRWRDGFWDILDSAVRCFGSGYYVLGSRNGDMRYTAATIAHLHIQFVVGDPDNHGEPVKLYMSSRPTTPPS